MMCLFGLSTGPHVTICMNFFNRLSPAQPCFIRLDFRPTLHFLSLFFILLFLLFFFFIIIFLGYHIKLYIL